MRNFVCLIDFAPEYPDGIKYAEQIRPPTACNDIFNYIQLNPSVLFNVRGEKVSFLQKEANKQNIIIATHKFIIFREGGNFFNYICKVFALNNIFSANSGILTLSTNIF